MARTRKTDAATVGDSDVTDGDEQSAVDEEKATTVLVRGKSSLPATAPDNIRYGHWSGGNSNGSGEGSIHWPGDRMIECRVSVAVLDRLKNDPNLSLSYDPAEEAIARANIAPDVQAQDLALQAAEAELRAKELKAAATAAEAAAAAASAQQEASLQRKRVEQLRQQQKSGA